MNTRYAIWDKVSPIYTPIGEELTPEQWIDRYGWLRPAGAVPVVAAGLVNGAFCGELSMMRQNAEADGAVFEDGLSDEELLDAIAAWETRVIEAPVTAEERIAAALEYQNIANMDDVTE